MWAVGMLTIMLRALLVVSVLAGLTAPARAEFWASSMGDLLKAAKRIEVIQVTAVSDTQVGAMMEGTLVTAIRSGVKVGAKVGHGLGYLPKPKVGDRVLLVCDDECPRAIGVERDGMFTLVAQQPMDGAIVTPTVVQAASVPLLAAGQPAPDLCIRGIVELLDDMARPGFDVKVRAADGTGRGTIAGRKVDAALSGVWFASQSNAIGLRLAVSGSVSLVADHIGRDKDGCFSSVFTPSMPLARTTKSLDRALDSANRGMTIARGTLVVAKGAPVPAGKHAISFTVNPEGYLQLASDLAEGQVSRIQRDAGHYGLGFGTKVASPNDPELMFDFPVDMLAAKEHGAALAKIVRGGATAQVTWLRGSTKTALGSITLDYVREPADLKPRARSTE